jgi:hypothetical protein
MASEAISSQLRRLTQNWTICVQAREPPARKSVARIKRYVCYLSSVLLPEQSLFATSGEARQVGDLLQDRIRFEVERGFDFWVLRDPWGNEFCVLQPEFPELLARREPWHDSSSAG